MKQPCAQCGGETANCKTCPFCGWIVTFVARPKAKRVKQELEQPIKLRIRDALIAAGCMVKVHNVDNRLMTTGLGRGVSDLICIVPPLGRFLAVEVKRPKVGIVSDDQRSFIAAVRKFGGIAGTATSVEEALALLEEARQPVLLDASPLAARDA